MIGTNVAAPGATHCSAAAKVGPRLRQLVIGLTAFLTLVDLFATQAILPSLVQAYGVTPAAMGVAVNASTIGMAIAGLGVAIFSRRLDRRRGIIWSLATLAIPTALLAIAPDLPIFFVLRVAQGLCMSAAFTLTLAYLAEHSSAEDQASAFAAYITGNVASNLVGRLVSATVADHLGLASNFLLFAALNLTGALLVYCYVDRVRPVDRVEAAPSSPLETFAVHLRNPPLRATFAIGFLILFAFIGTFTFVNFVLVRAPIGIAPMTLGLVYFVFLPSIFTTLLAGRAVKAIGTQRAFWAGIASAGIGLPLLLASSLAPVLLGLALVGVGTFFGQAIATGFIGKAATIDRGAASGLYLASYFGGGLAGSLVLGHLFDRSGWPACVAGIGLSLLAAALLARQMRPGLPVAR